MGKKLNLRSLIKKKLSKIINFIANHPEQFSVPRGAFSRKGKWTIEKLLKILLQMDTKCLFKSIWDALPIRERAKGYTVSGFIQKRDKLTIRMFLYLFKEITKYIVTAMKKRGLLEKYKSRYKGLYYVLACDGSDFPLPTECVPSEPDADTHRKVQHKMMHQNALYDVLNKLYVAITLVPKLQCSERNELLQLASALAERNLVYKPENSIITCDRGYEGFDVFAKLSALGCKFVIRLKSVGQHGVLHCADIQIPEGDEFVDQDITFRCKKRKDGVYKSAKSSVNCEEFSYRLVAFKLENGKTEYLLTNLPKEEFSSEDIADIYQKRWDIEVSFRDQKYSLGSVVFHSKKLDAQQMELYAALTAYNCISAIVQCTDIPSEKEESGYIISFKDSVTICLDYLLRRINIEMEEILLQHLVLSTSGRSYKRDVGIRQEKGFYYR